MKAIVCTKYEPPDILQFKEAKKTTSKDNEVKQLLSLILLIFFLQVSTIALSQSPNNHNYLELTGTWKYRWGESPLNEEGVPLWITKGSLTEEWKPITYELVVSK